MMLLNLPRSDVCMKCCWKFSSEGGQERVSELCFSLDIFLREGKQKIRCAIGNSRVMYFQVTPYIDVSSCWDWLELDCWEKERT